MSITSEKRKTAKRKKKILLKFNNLNVGGKFSRLFPIGSLPLLLPNFPPIGKFKKKIYIRPGARSRGKREKSGRELRRSEEAKAGRGGG